MVWLAKREARREGNLKFEHDVPDSLFEDRGAGVEALGPYERKFLTSVMFTPNKKAALRSRQARIFHNDAFAAGR